MDPERRRASGGAATAAGPSAPASDEVLFAQVAHGDGDAYSALYQKYFHELYDFAARITRDRTAAADIVQSVFATAWERAQGGEQVRQPRAWLYRLTRNAAIDELRRRRWTSGSEGDQAFDFTAIQDADSPEPTRVLIEKEVAELVWSTAAAMKPDEYALLDLHVRRELSPDELSDQLGITTGAVYTRLSRLRDSFEDALTVNLLTRRGGEDCRELGELVAALGAEADTEQGRRSLRSHIRDCSTCQQSRRRYVTASEILAGFAPVPLTPDVQAAIWAALCRLLGIGVAGGGQAASHGARHAAPRPGQGAKRIGLAALVLAILAVVGVAAWTGVSFLLSAPPAGVAHDPARFWSPSHDAGERSSENRITVAWSRQPDAVAYSILWSHEPREEPDTTPELPGSATRVKSPALAPGRWYFHLRTEGSHEAWTHTVHLGPFVIVALRSGQPARSGAEPTTSRRPGEAAQPAGTPAAAPTPDRAAPDGSGAPPGGTRGPSAPSAPDTAPPSGQSVEPVGGPYYRTLAVPLVLTHGSDRESGIDAASGVVERLSGVLAEGSCGRWDATWSTVVLRGSADTSVVDGRCYRYRYRIADRSGNQSAFSAPSGIVVVDTTPPAPPTLVFSESAAATSIHGTTIFYRPDGDGGTFVVAASSADTGSGLAAIEFPRLADGMSTIGETRRTMPPYEVAYRWTRGAAEDGTKVVTAYDRAGNAASSSFTLTTDATPPTGMSVSLLGGPSFATTDVPLSIEVGSDSESGVDPASLFVERDSAPLVGGVCGAFGGGWTAVSLVSGSDARVQSGYCYRYRVSVADNVGNRATSPPSGDLAVDTSPPSTPALSLSTSSSSVHVAGTTVFYRPSAGGSLTVDAATGDRESALEQVVFPALAGAAGGGSDTIEPYGTSYNWSAGLTTTGAQTVVASNRAGLSASSSFTLTADATPPTGMSVSLLGGPSFATTDVPLSIEVGSDSESGVDPASPFVERDSAPLIGGVCGAFGGGWTAVSLVSGSDTSVQSGYCYRYRVSVADNVGNRATSPPSGDASVLVVLPAGLTLSLSTSSDEVHVMGSDVFYRAGGAGSLTVEAAVDPASGITEVVFSAIAGAAGGGADTTAPFQAAYSWAAGFTGTGAQTVTASSGALPVATGSFTLTADATGPTGVAVTLLGGRTWFPGAVITLTIDEGSDAGSGSDPTSLLVERDSAPLLAGPACGAFSGTWTIVPITGNSDGTVSSGFCYRYRVSVADNVGNRTVSLPSDDAMVP